MQYARSASLFPMALPEDRNAAITGARVRSGAIGRLRRISRHEMTTRPLGVGLRPSKHAPELQLDAVSVYSDNWNPPLRPALC